MLAAGANLTYQYGQHGAIKEIAMVLLVAAAAAVTAEALATGVRPGFGAVLALCLAPIVLVLSAGGARTRARRRAGGRCAGRSPASGRPRACSPRRPASARSRCCWRAGAVIGDVVSYARGRGHSFETPGGGNGSRRPRSGISCAPLPAVQAAGIWFGQDYRFALAGGTEACRPS